MHPTLKTTLEVINPLHPRGGYALPYLPVLIAVAILFYGLGFFTARTIYNAGYYRSHEALGAKPLHPPTARVPIAFKTAPLPVRGSMNLTYLPSVLDQGGTGGCAAQAGPGEAGTVILRQAGVGWKRISPRQVYSWYSDDNNGGADKGSNFSGLLSTMQQHGVVWYNAYPQGQAMAAKGYAAYAVDNPVLNLGSPKRFNIQGEMFFTYFGAGYGGIQQIEQGIVTNHVVPVGMQVTNLIFSAASNGLLYSQPGAGIIGAHEMGAVAFDNSKPMPDGSTGAVLFMQSWGTNYGVNKYGVRGSSNGFLWVSINFLLANMFEAGEYHYGSFATATPPKELTHFKPSHGKLYKPPFDPGVLSSVNQLAGGLWYVHGVKTHDTNYDETSLLNFYGDFLQVPPIALVATQGTESGFRQYADRCCIPGDTSYGGFQFTLGTACGYGICGSPDYIRSQLDNPAISIRLAAQYYRDALTYHGNRVGFPYAYVFYNAGYGVSDSYALNPPYGSVAWSNFVSNFLPNWRYSIYQYGGAPPKPKPYVFPRLLWGNLSPYYCGRPTNLKHCGYSWAASVWSHNLWLGHALDYGHYYVVGRHGFSETQFQHGSVVTYPWAHTAKVVRS